MRAVAMPAVAFAALVCAWEVSTRLLHVNPVVLPPPSAVVGSLRADAALLLRETAVTMLEAACGFLVGAAGAYVVAIAFVHSRSLRDALFPYAIALKATPLIAIAPILVVWFGNGLASKIVMSALVAFFPVLVNSATGLAAIDREALDLMRSLSASPWQILLKIRIPSSLSYLFAALKIASSLAVVGAVIGEFTGATKGIGHLIVTSSYYLETSRMFAGVIMIALGGIAFFVLIDRVGRRIVFWTTLD